MAPSPRRASASSGGAAYDTLVDLVRRGFHWDNLIQFCALIKRDGDGDGESNGASGTDQDSARRAFEDALAAVELGFLSSDAQVCLSGFLYAEHVVQNFKGTPTSRALLKRFSSDAFKRSILEAVETHISDQSVINQVCKCLIDWSKAALENQGDEEGMVEVSNTFLELFEQTQEFGSRWLQANSTDATQSQQRRGSPSSSNAAGAVDSFEQQLARALELSTLESHPVVTYQDDEQAIEAVLLLSKLEQDMQGVQQANTRLVTESSTIAGERDEGLRAADELRRDLEGVLAQLTEAQIKLEAKGRKLTTQMSGLKLSPRGSGNALEKMADLSKDYSSVENDLRKVRKQKELVHYAASELRAIDEFVVKENMTEEQSRKIHESIVGELMEKIIAGDPTETGIQGAVPASVLMELRQRFGDTSPDVEGPKTVGKKISNSLRKFMMPKKEKEKEKVEKKRDASTPSPVKKHPKVLTGPKKRAQVQSEIEVVPDLPESPGSAKSKAQPSKDEMKNFLKDIQQASAAAGKTSPGARATKPAAGVTPPPPPPPMLPGKGKGKFVAPPPPPPPGAMVKTSPGLNSDLKRAPQVVALYQELRKALLGSTTDGPSSRPSDQKASGNNEDTSVIVAELQERSSYINQIKADVQYYGQFIEDLAKEVNKIYASDMQGLSLFVDKIDRALSVLTDERAVLKNFNWPEAKYDTMREATAMHMELTNLQRNCSDWKCGQEPSEVECAKISAYFDKIRQKIERIANVQESLGAKFRDHKIPWDNSTIPKSKQATLNLCKLFLKAILADVAKLERQRTQTAMLRINSLLVSAVRYSFRVHQFVSGFNPECISLFEEISRKLKQYPTAARPVAT